MGTELVGFTSAFTSTSTIIAIGILSGSSYQFRYRAENVYGYGDFSDVITIKAAQVPSQMNAVTTSIENQYVKFAWSYPTDNSDTVT